MTFLPPPSPRRLPILRRMPEKGHVRMPPAGPPLSGPARNTTIGSGTGEERTMTTRIAAWALGAAAAATAGAAGAHHAFTAQYDSEQPVAVTGVVVKIEWLNPHAYFFVDVADEDGEVVTWAAEMGSPVVLMRQGWTRDSMKIGDEVAVEGIRAQDGR